MTDPLPDLAKTLRKIMPNIGTYHRNLDWLNAAHALTTAGFGDMQEAYARGQADALAEYRLTLAADAALRKAARAVVDAWTDDESGMETFDPELIDQLAAALKEPNRD